MFKQQRQQQEAAQRRRVTLEPLTQAPNKGDLQVVLTEAQNARGVLIEVQIRREQPPVFVLTCQWDPHASDPAWALYEGQDGSKTLWSYPNSDLEMVYEMVYMSIPSNKSSGPLPTELAPPPAPPPEPQQAPQHHAQQAAPAPAPGYNQPYPNAAPPGYPPQQGYPPQPYPQQPYPPQQGYPQQPYPPQQGYPQPGYQYPPGQVPPQQPYPQQAPPPGWGQPGYPQQQYPQQPPAPNAYPAAAGYTAPPPGPAADNDLKPADLAGFVDLLNKNTSNLLIGHLFVEAGVVPEPCLEAALKIQELVRKNELSNAAAIEALRITAEQGGSLTEEIVNRARAAYPAGSVAPPRAQQAGPGGAQDPREAARQVIYLIQHSGIVTENDISTAEGVRRKHGGDVGNILVAAGKIEKATLDAARRCQPLVREHKLNADEVSRILQHCQKTRATVEDACRDLAIRPL